MRSGNWPARPTKGSPTRSSCSPGASPTSIQRALVLPTPKTVLRRPLHRAQASQPDTVSCSVAQSMDSTPVGRAPKDTDVLTGRAGAADGVAPPRADVGTGGGAAG